MPLYEYQCADCNHVDTDIRSPSHRDDKLTCSKCGALSTRNLFPFGHAIARLLVDEPVAATLRQRTDANAHPHLVLDNCLIEGVKTGIRAPDSVRVSVKGTTFKNV